MSRESFLRRATDSPSNSSSHRRAKKQEREVAKRVRGRLTPGSGNKNEKGDVRVKGVCRIETKTTKHASFSVSLDMVAKLEDAALPTNEIPIIVIEFNNGSGKKIKELVVVPSYVLDSLT